MEDRLRSHGHRSGVRIPWGSFDQSEYRNGCWVDKNLPKSPWDHSPPCQSLVLPCLLGSSPPRRACSGHCQMRACVAGAGSPALPALPAWSPAYPATCSSPAPATSPPAHCLPAASTSTPTHPAGHPASFQPLAMASQRRNVSLGKLVAAVPPPPGARKWGTLQMGRHLVVICVARPCEGGKGAQVLQGSSRS